MLLKMGHLAHSTDVRVTRLKGETFEVTDLKAEVADLRKDMDYLKSSDFTSLLEVADDVDSLTTSKIPPTTTGDIHRDVMAAEDRDVETDEEQIDLRDAEVYDDMADLEDVMFETACQTSLRVTTISGSNGANPSEVTPGTEAQV
ncbi:hypothetical protein H5410_056787 [Solanum commersonii]|uniref:Polyprotein protein n=1 Tax=Solanum commersonii TaxID=4109 RepID=A0A9J5WMS5_SOLCO|nr:hypothetical protein H5410_056787 [Solanum commersonii]